MLINTAFSHYNEECSPYFLVITHQTQAKDGIDGLIKERRNSIANALEYVFLAPCHRYKQCHLCPPPLLFPSMQWNQYDNASSFFKNFIIILYRDISRVLYWDCQIRYTQPLPPLPILTLIIEVKLTLSSHSTLFPRYVTDIVGVRS